MSLMKGRMWHVGNMNYEDIAFVQCVSVKTNIQCTFVTRQYILVIRIGSK